MFVPKIIPWGEKNITAPKIAAARATMSEKAAQLRELTSKKIALDERLDARIDKAIKRLTQLKAFKQIVEEQASRARIDQPSIADDRSQTSTN